MSLAELIRHIYLMFLVISCLSLSVNIYVILTAKEVADRDKSRSLSSRKSSDGKEVRS